MHLGRDRVICAFEVDGLIVDPGPASCLDTLIDRLGPVEPRALLLTHIHLDHAGASGVLCRRYPNLKVYVHERGAPHLVDPSKLVASATRLYGDAMDELWGEMAPVPEERITALAGGESVEGFRVAYTPGHASHHVCYLHEDSGDAYVGDMAGVRIPPEHATPSRPRLRPTSTSRRGSTRCTRSPAGTRRASASPTSARSRTSRSSCTGSATPCSEAADSARLDGEERFIARLEDKLAAATDPATVETYEQAAPPDQLYAGLERYWRKKAEPR